MTTAELHVVCRHPLCEAVASVAEFCCVPHWRGLPAAIRDQIVAASRSESRVHLYTDDPGMRRVAAVVTQAAAHAAVIHWERSLESSPVWEIG